MKMWELFGNPPTPVLTKNFILIASLMIDTTVMRRVRAIAISC